MKYITCLVSLSIALMVMIIIAMSIGIIPISPWHIVINHLTDEQWAVLTFVRLPRILVALLVGASLALAGTVMQGVFQNPLADPGIMGVISGSSLGAVIAVALGLTSVAVWYMPLFAFVGAFGALGLTLSLTYHQGRMNPKILLLAGVAISILLGAFTSGILTLMSEYRLKEFLFWMVGSLEYRRWEHVYVALPIIAVSTSLLLALAKQLNTLVLGDTEARSLGMNVNRYRLVLLGLSALITAVSVCIGGSIGFVGLIVPHMMRLIIGPDHRYVLPLSAMGGAFFLLLCDTLGRTLFQPVDLRVGIMTAIIGTPYFLYLLHRIKVQEGL